MATTEPATTVPGSGSKPLGPGPAAYAFGAIFEAAQITRLEDKYLDYDSLRTLINRLKDKMDDLANSQKYSNNGELIDEMRRENRIEFCKALTKEMTKVGSYYSSRMTKYDKLYGFLHEEPPSNYIDTDSIQVTKSGHFRVVASVHKSHSTLNDTDNTNDNNNSNNNNKDNNNNKKNDNNNNNTTKSEATSTQQSEDLSTNVTTQSQGANQEKKERERERRGSVDGVITLKKLRDALDVLDTLSIFWHLNEQAILAIFSDYERILGDKKIVAKLLKITDFERGRFLKLNANRSNSDLSKLVSKSENEETRINPSDIMDSTLQKDGEKLLIAWNKWQRRKTRLAENIEFLHDEISKIHEIIQEMVDQKENQNKGDGNESDDESNEPMTVRELKLDELEAGTITRVWLEMVDGPLYPIKIPVIIAKGLTKGPVIGITAALHGNEVNGIQMLHELFKELDISDVSGTLIAVPVLNPPGFELRQREFNSKQDLNRLFPGKPDGNRGQIYVHSIQQKIFTKLNYLIDLHTASHGRENSLYVRADMNHEVVKNMALLQNPEIIVHNTAPDGSARGAAMKIGVPSITVEIGNPQRFQEKYITYALEGVTNVLAYFHVIHEPIVQPRKIAKVCIRSEWSYVQHGGTLEVRPKLNEWVRKGQTVAIVRNIFGDQVYRYKAPSDGIVIGRNIDPICQAGDRLLHIGYIGSEFPEGKVNDGH